MFSSNSFNYIFIHKIKKLIIRDTCRCLNEQIMKTTVKLGEIEIKLDTPVFVASNHIQIQQQDYAPLFNISDPGISVNCNLHLLLLLCSNLGCLFKDVPQYFFSHFVLSLYLNIC